MGLWCRNWQWNWIRNRNVVLFCVFGLLFFFFFFFFWTGNVVVVLLLLCFSSKLWLFPVWISLRGLWCGNWQWNWLENKAVVWYLRHLDFFILAFLQTSYFHLPLGCLSRSCVAPQDTHSSCWSDTYRHPRGGGGGVLWSLVWRI